MVDRSLFDEYRQALSANADLLELVVTRLVTESAGMGDEEARAYLEANYPKWVQAFGKVAASAAREFYRRNRAMHFDGDEDAEPYEAQPARAIEDSWALEDVRRAEEKGYGTLPGLAVARVMRRADETIAYNVARDPSRPRWAIVPKADACGFCVLVASNGFFMHNRPVHVERHDNCRCVAVSDHDTTNPHLDGYDPKAMQQAYADAYDTVRDDLQRQWDALPDERKAKYLKKGGRGFDGFRRDQIVAEMNRRNRDWLQTGVPRFRTKEPGAKPLKKERDVGTALLMHGFDVEFARETPPDKRFDAWLNGEPWEIKIPQSFNEKTVKNQFKKALGKGTDKLLISATWNKAPIDSLIADVRTLFDNGEFEAITEVLLVSAYGDIVRMKRPLPRS